MTSQFINHCGGQRVSFQDLRTITKPEETETYVPVGHDWLALQVKAIGTSYLGECIDSQYSLNKNGMQMFGVHKFKNHLAKDACISLGFRNSMDKSIPVGLVGGLNVFVCDNMAFYGTEKRVRRHTKNVVQDVYKHILNICNYIRDTGWEEFLGFKEVMAETPVNDDQAWAFLGRCYDNSALADRQLKKARHEWKTPLHADWLPRNAWSLYNACTEALKSTRPSEVTGRYLELTRQAQLLWDPNLQEEIEICIDTVSPPPIPEGFQAGANNRFQMLEIEG